MRWLLIFLCAPAAAGEFSLVAETWAQDRDAGYGIEYAEDEWSVIAARYQNDFEEVSWYGGMGYTMPLFQNGEWGFSAGLYAMYFKHHGENVTFLPATGEPAIKGGDVVVPVDTMTIRTYERTEYFAPSPALTLSRGMFGLSLTTIQLPSKDWSTSLRLKLTF